MAIDVDEIVRRLLLLGIPIVPLGCDAWSSCPDSPAASQREMAEIQRPTSPDAGSAISLESFQRCLDTGDCLALCRAHWRHASVRSCERVGPDAAASDDRVTVRADVVAICEGRRPQGHRAPAQLEARCEIGAWLARAAHLEAASVPAFDRLARELDAHGAPAELARAARRSAGDERRHTRMMARLAARHGACVPATGDRLPDHVRPLEAVAHENAAEGCVRETVGALLARWQASWAQDHAIRAVMTTIARDEARHAELAWRVDAWANTKLPPASRARVAKTRATAARQLAREVARAEVPPALLHAAGIPNRGATLALTHAAGSLLWPGVFG